MKRKFFTLIALSILGLSSVKAQLNVGGTTATDSASVLKVTSGGNKGFFPPKVALTDTLTAAPLTTPAVGLMVFNTNKIPAATGANVTPGYYYYSGAKWVRMITSAGADNDIRYLTGGNHISADAGVGANGSNAGSGGSNIAIGASAIKSVTNGTSLIAIGANALGANTSGGDNVAYGRSAMGSSTSGSANVAVGSAALSGLTIGDGNVALGYGAVGGAGPYGGNVGIGYTALSNATGGNNVAIGQYALVSAVGSASNTAVGFGAGSNLVSGNGNIALGNSTTLPVTNGSNQLNIGNAIFGTGLNGTGYSAPAGNIGIGTATPNTNAALQVSSPNGDKGFMLPSVALASTTSFAPLAAHVAGMLVYNTATTGDVTPGLYINDGAKWAKITGAAATNSATSNGTAVVSAYTPGAITGTLTTGTPASGVTQAVTATVTTAGTYNISTSPSLLSSLPV